MSTATNYQPTHRDIGDWRSELTYLQRKVSKSGSDRRRINALRSLLASHAKF